MTIIEVPEGYRWEITRRNVGGGYYKGIYCPQDTYYYLSYQKKISRRVEIYTKKHWWSLWKSPEIVLRHDPIYDWTTLHGVRLPEIFNEEIIRETAMEILYTLAEKEPALLQIKLHESFVGTYPPKTLDRPNKGD